MGNDGESFGGVLRGCRRAAGLSQDELAARSGLSVRTISNLEAGRIRWPYPNSVHRLADALGLSTDEREKFIARAGRRLAAATGETSESVTAGTSVPRQLPAAARHFTGRHAELGMLTRLVTQTDGGAGTVVISAINGMAGIGKTGLAVHWAHQHADRFPDGQLYVNLRGFDPSGEPVPPTTAIRGFLTALGVPAHRIPAEPDEQTALYRSQLAGRRMLIVADNARDVDQVRPLLPGTAGCLLVVTSRNRLGGLVAIEGAVPLTLDLLTEQESRELLSQRLGFERVAADERAVDELVAACARLPLALNIAAARAALLPAGALPTFVAELCDTRGRLDTLTIRDATRDDTADVRAVFSWSYRALDTDAARVFRLLGLHPGPDISAAAVAGLSALDPQRTRRALDELTSAHLITEHTPGRYSLHDLLRAYAAEQTHTHDTDADRRAALCRVYAFYLHTAARLLAPERSTIQLDPAAPGVHPQPLPDVTAALAWFDAEHAVLLAGQQFATARKWYLTVFQLAWLLRTFHVRRGHRVEALTVSRAALRAASHLPDPAVRVRAHQLLGSAYADLGYHEEATGQLCQALALVEHHPDPEAQADTHNALAFVWYQRGDGSRALQHATQALDLYRALDRPVPQARILGDMGWYAALAGDYDTARTHSRAALTLHHQHDDPAGEASTLEGLAYIEQRTGHHHEAIDHCQQALVLYRSVGNTSYYAITLDELGHAHAAVGQHEQARTVWWEAVRLYQEQGRTEDAARVQGQLDTLDDLDT